MDKFLVELKKFSSLHFLNKNIVLVGGCFDVLHFAHIHFLKEAKKMGDVLVVLLESDEFIIKHKFRQPIHSQSKRKIILENLRTVDYVISLPLLNGYEDYLKIITAISPKTIVITENDPQTENKHKQAQIVHAKFQTVDFLPQFSTTQILQKNK